MCSPKSNPFDKSRRRTTLNRSGIGTTDFVSVSWQNSYDNGVPRLFSLWSLHLTNTWIFQRKKIMLCWWSYERHQTTSICGLGVISTSWAVDEDTVEYQLMGDSFPVTVKKENMKALIMKTKKTTYRTLSCDGAKEGEEGFRPLSSQCRPA